MTPDAQDEPASPKPLPSASRPETPPPGHSTRDRIVDALLELAAEREWDDFGIADIATRAGVSLADFRDAFPSKGAVLGAFSRRVDRAVLDAQVPAISAEESPRERLFEVLMRRLDILAPHRLALQSIGEWVRREPLSAAALNGVVLNSMRFMLAAAGIENEGTSGTIKLQGLAIAWSRVLDVWVEDDDPNLSRTMATLDKQLSRGETWSARVDDLDRLVSPLRLLARAVADSRRRRKDRRETSAKPEPLDDYDAGGVV